MLAQALPERPRWTKKAARLTMNFCSQCGHPVRQLIPDGDHRLRDVCNHCNTIHYQNPRVIAGCLPAWGDQVLLCRRAIEPRYGFWTLPAGFMENGESMAEAAIRETREEACTDVKQLELYSLFDLPMINQVHVFYRAELCAAQFAATEESLEVALFDEQDIPWSELAFPTISRTLECFFADRKRLHYPVRNESMDVLRRYYNKI